MSALARRPVLGIGAAVSIVLVAVSGRYGYHRDELYFIAAGRHLAWGYPDQPPLVPAVARARWEVAPDSLVLLRLSSALIAGAVVVLAGLMAQRLGARSGGQALAAAATAFTGLVLGMGHLLSTSTYDLLGWTLITYLLLRLLQDDDRRLWPLVGLVAGVTMVANVLVAFLLLGFAVSLLLVGPRRLLLRPGPWVGAAIAALFAVPYLVWQARHGWPQLEVADNIANGGSGSSAPRLLFLPLVVLQVGPWLLPIWLTGLVRLWRDAALRSLAMTFLVLLVVFLATGGKPYYLAGLMPLFLAAGAQPLLDRVRRAWVAPALLVLSLPALVFTLPLLPPQDTDVVVAVNYDAGETIGWPEFASQVATAYRALPEGTAILAGNYGEAGAVDRYGPDLGLPRAHSGHNGYAEWGAPPGSTPVLAIGIDAMLLDDVCSELRPLGHLESAHGVDNDEDGTSLDYCVPGRPWSSVWDRLTHVG
jgi:4-amino-4-deoxy-L-arabinose transferase-like glycosyltransferase